MVDRKGGPIGLPTMGRAACGGSATIARRPWSATAAGQIDVGGRVVALGSEKRMGGATADRGCGFQRPVRGTPPAEFSWASSLTRPGALAAGKFWASHRQWPRSVMFARCGRRGKAFCRRCRAPNTRPLTTPTFPLHKVAGGFAVPRGPFAADRAIPKIAANTPPAELFHWPACRRRPSEDVES
jgi:hypothetical protein